MQTLVPVSAESNKQQNHNAQHPTQLLAEQQSAFEDHSPQAAQLTSLQAMMSNSPPQLRTQAMQAKMNGSAQVQQMRTLQASMASGDVAQREEAEEPLQAQVDGGAVQREEVATASKASKPNNTGLPDNLKSGIESLSGMSMDHVKVHYNSSQPAQLNAHAYAQGSEIHVAPGQEQHVPHEAWHVVQQAQGRVKPTMQMKAGGQVNDDVGLEAEADVMGVKAMVFGAVQMRKEGDIGMLELTPSSQQTMQTMPDSQAPIQRKAVAELDAHAQASIGAGGLDAIRLANPTMTIGATHTGDMYHLKAAKSLFPQLNTLICDVTAVNNDISVNKAFEIGSYMNDRPQTYYTDQPKPGAPVPTGPQLAGVTHGTPIAWRRWINEGTTTSLIMNASMNSGDAGTTEKTAMQQGTAPIGIGDGAWYGLELGNHGFLPATPYILVNFRESGHTVVNGAGGVHPELDTGTTGYDEIIAAVQAQFPAAVIVPMGEQAPGGGGAFPASLINYWTWACCAGSRERQAGLLRHLNENFTVLGAVGMRSGGMDMLAFAGIKIVSIDISPSKPGGSSGGWERGSKLERALGPQYGRAFISNTRATESAMGPTMVGRPGWTGSFHANDRATIGVSAGLFLDPAAPPALGTKDPSHPLATANLDAFILRLNNVAPVNGVSMAPPIAPLSHADRTYINKIRNLINVAYTQVPHGAAYRASIDNLLL